MLIVGLALAALAAFVGYEGLQLRALHRDQPRIRLPGWIEPPPDDWVTARAAPLPLWSRVAHTLGGMFFG
jgi:hypothetical protein